MDGNIALLTGTSIRNYELKQDACFIGSWIQMNVDETWTSGHQDTVVSHFAHGTCPSSSFSVQVGCLCGLWRAGPRSPCQAAQPWVSGSWTSRGTFRRNWEHQRGWGTGACHISKSGTRGEERLTADEVSVSGMARPPAERSRQENGGPRGCPTVGRRSLHISV